MPGAVNSKKFYLCIDLKSFYASVECVTRGLDPMTTNLIVADPDRKNGTICLAVSPSMKALGVKNRCRVFQIPKGIDYIMAPPQMKLYIRYSTDIYAVYLKYISKDDIQVYSIDEAFLDVTDYLNLYKMSARQLALTIMNDILKTTGIPAACGIGTNLYLAKVALDITAKHSIDRTGYLNEELYQKILWTHQPLTDFWRIGPGTAKRLANIGINTMGEVAQADEALLYKTFGIDAEYLIDHAWGKEPATISQIKSYVPKANSLSSGQVLMRDYNYEDGLLIVKEMADLLCLDLVDKCLVTNCISLHIGYSNHIIPSVNKTVTLTCTTSSGQIISESLIKMYEQIVDKNTAIRRVTISFNNVTNNTYEQYDLFTNSAKLERERRIQKCVNEIKRKYGKNAILKGMNLLESATTMERNTQIGGHRAGPD